MASDITDEMIERCAHAYAEGDGYDWEDVSQLWQARYRRQAFAGLEAALAGRTVVELPEPDDATDCPVWDLPHGELTAGTGAGDGLVRTPSGAYLRPESAERYGAAVIAAAREARRLAGSVGSETPGR